MLIHHHSLNVTLTDAWLLEAGCAGFTPSTSAYRVDEREQKVHQICISDIEPVKRAAVIAVFNHCRNQGLSARERTVRILPGLVKGDALPPVELVRTFATSPQRFRIINGTHRIYCSLALGFTHVPTIKGFDLTAFDRGEASKDGDLND